MRNTGIAPLASWVYGCALALAVASAHAQETAEPERPDSAQSVAAEGPIDEVMVTARRRSERQQDVPLAITALSEDFLKRNAVEHLYDLNGKVPALRIDNFNSPSYTNIGIRAHRSANVAPGQDSAVGYYFSEVNFAYPIGINQQMFDLQSVEVVKGPQGTLFGRNTTGGAILITPARPTETFEGSARLGTVTFDDRLGYNATAVLNLPASDTWQFRVSANAIQRDGHVDNLITAQQLATYEVVPYLGTTDGDAMNDEESLGWRVSALWRPGASVDSFFSYQGSRLRANGTAYTLTALDPNGAVNFATGGGALDAFNRRLAQQEDNFWTTEQGADLYNRLDAHSVLNVTTWAISDTLTLKNVAGARSFDLEDSLGISGLPYQLLDVRINDEGEEWSEELQLQGQSGDGRFSWVLGAFYFDQHIEHPNDTLALPQFGLVPNAQQSEADNDSRAAFAQGTIAIPGVEGLSITGGVRWTEDNREMTSSRWTSTDRTTCALTDENGVVLPADACFLHGETSYEKNTYNVGLDYRVNDDTLFYVAHRRGYRAGGWNYLPDNPQTFGPFDPEQVTDYEGGIKRDWRFGDVRLRTNLAIYTQDYEGIQRFSSPVSDPTSFTVINAADASIDGGELEITLVPFDGLEISGFYSRIEADFENFVTGAGDFSDNEFAQVPKDQYSARIRYQLPLDPSTGRISFQADYYHQSHVFFTDTAEGPGQGPPESQGQDAYGILNLRIDWESVFDSSFDAALYVKNAEATEYNAFGIQLYPSLGYNIATIGEPRIVGLEATFRF